MSADRRRSSSDPCWATRPASSKRATDVDPLLINDNDLWVSTRKKLSDPWSAPVKLGPNVNSDLDDVRAYIAPDGKTLYFESGPNEPNGDLDIYMTTRSTNGRCD